MRPRLIVDNSKNSQVVPLGKTILVEEEKPRLYIDYGMANFLIWLSFFTGFFAGVVAIGMAWIFSGT